MNLRLKNISLPLAGLTLEIDVELHSQVTAIFGPSGGGKTSLLDTLAGLRRPRSAFIELNGRVLTDTAAGVEVPTRLREIGYVPQDLALFPHLSVRRNLLLRPQARGRVASALQLRSCGESFGNRLPHRARREPALRR